MPKSPTSVLRKLAAVVALVIGIGTASASVTAATAAPAPAATSQHGQIVADWAW